MIVTYRIREDLPPGMQVEYTRRYRGQWLAILAAPRFGCLNIHASLLPRWRGAAPIQRALLAGDAQQRDGDYFGSTPNRARTCPPMNAMISVSRAA